MSYVIRHHQYIGRMHASGLPKGRDTAAFGEQAFDTLFASALL